jgi:hypothetical protein
MKALYLEFPDVRTIVIGLITVLGGNKLRDHRVTILRRQSNEYTFLHELFAERPS